MLFPVSLLSASQTWLDDFLKTLTVSNSVGQGTIGA